MSTKSRLISLLQAFIGKPKAILISRDDEGRLELELIREGGTLAAKIESVGLRRALPSLTGVPIEWGADETRVT